MKSTILFKLRKIHRWYYFITLILIVCLISSSVFSLLNKPKKMVLGDSTHAWDINTNSDYTYDDTKIEFAGGVARLKGTGVPGTNWIAIDGENNWGKRKNITLSNTAGSAQTNYQVLITTDTTGGDFQADCDDIRFTNADGKTGLDYWLEPNTCNTATTKLWVEVDSIVAPPTTTTIYMYYNNPNATAASSIANTFIREVSGLKAAWNMDDASGTSIADSSGNSNTGTAVRDTTTTGKFGNARNFNGTSDYIEVPNSDTVRNNGTSAWTAETWVFPTSVTDHSYHAIMSKQYSPGFWFGLYANTGQMQTWLNNAARVNTTPLVQLNQWNHIVSSYSAGTLTVYVNNVAATPITGIGSTLAIGTDTLRIGMDREGGTPMYFFTGKIDDLRLYNSALSSTDVGDIYNNFAYSTTNYPGKALVRKRATTEPTVSDIATAVTLYPTTSPTLTSNTGQGYSAISAFSETLGAGSTGVVKYQISPDNGTSWYWWNGSTWTATLLGYAEASTSTDINTHLDDGSFNSIGAPPKTCKWRAYLNSDGTQQPKLDGVNITYVWDTADPDNPAALSTSKTQKTDGSDIVSNNWDGHASPYFTWAEPTDHGGEGESASGIAGYYIYFGTTATGDPHTANGIATDTGSGVHYQTDRDFEVGIDTLAIASGSTYYLRIETRDNAGNIKHLAVDDPSLFTYQYDGLAPNSPVYASVSPSGYSRTNSFTFSWPTEGANSAADTGGSTLGGYQYKINSGSWSDTFNAGTKSLTDVAVAGVNIFYLRAIDTAGNTDVTPVQTNFYFNNAAPTTPTNLAVTPSGDGDNAFSFSWNLPLIYNGSVAGYYYSINALPTLANISYVTDSSLPEGPYATQQGENTLYLVAKDEAGNYDLGSCQSIQGNPTTDSCAKVEFTANTSAPGMPTNLTLVDGSNRDLKAYKVFLTWEAPVSRGTGFNGYEIYRSSDNANFSSVGSTSGTTYADTGLSSQIYYYNVKSKDNAGQYSVASSSVSILPTGKYTSPPTLVAEPKITVSSYNSTITWQTDRNGSSFIDYGVSSNALGAINGGETKGQLDDVTDHSVILKGLLPSTTYYYRAVWVDVDGNQGRSEILSFITKVAPRVSEVDSSSNVTLNSLLVNWSTTVVGSCSINYGPSNTYGGIIREPVGALASSHSQNIMALTHSTTYHYQISCTDIENNVFTSDDYKQDTLIMPVVSEFRFETVDAPTTALKFTWKTNVPTSSIATYQAGGGAVQSQSDAEYKLNHEITISNLSDKTTYILQVKGVDEHGNVCQSDANTFATPDDTRPPKVSELTIEIKSSGFGDTQKAQAIVSWKSDEPGTSQVEYAQGISGADYNFKTKEDGGLALNHVVIVSDLDPSKIYHLRAVSRDKAGNAGTSEDTTVITGKVQKSVLDIIMNSLQTSLGWLFNVFN